MTTQKLTEGLNEPANMLITYGFCLKNHGFESYVFREYGKPSSQTNYDLQKLEILWFPVSLSDELGRLSPWVQKSQEVFETLKREEFT